MFVSLFVCFVSVQIIYANVSTKDLQPVSLTDAQPPFEVLFTYSVHWHRTRFVANIINL